MKRRSIIQTLLNAWRAIMDPPRTALLPPPPVEGLIPTSRLVAGTEMTLDSSEEAFLLVHDENRDTEPDFEFERITVPLIGFASS